MVSSSFDGYSPPDNNDTFPEKTCGSSWQMPCHASIGLGSLEVEAKGRFIVTDHVLFILFRSILYITVECNAFCKLQRAARLQLSVCCLVLLLLF